MIYKWDTSAGDIKLSSQYTGKYIKHTIYNVGFKKYTHHVHHVHKTARGDIHLAPDTGNVSTKGRHGKDNGPQTP